MQSVFNIISKGDRIGINAFDALTVNRPYHEAVPFGEAKNRIMAASGSLLDPAAVASFLEASEELEEYVGKIMI